jgi:hypothetical protein
MPNGIRHGIRELPSGSSEHEDGNAYSQASGNAESLYHLAITLFAGTLY